MSATGPVTASPSATTVYSTPFISLESDVKAHQAMLAALCPALTGPYKDDEAMESAIDRHLTKEVLSKCYHYLKEQAKVDKQLLNLIEEVLAKY